MYVSLSGILLIVKKKDHITNRMYAIQRKEDLIRV